MKKVPFDYMAGPILSSFNILCSALYDEDLLFDFVEYVNCQIHMPILSEFYKRNTFVTLGAYEHITRKSNNPAACAETLKYFYTDMLNMLVKMLKEKPELETQILVQARLLGDNSFSTSVKSLEGVKEQLDELLENPEGTETPYSAILTRFTVKEMAALKPTNNLAMASILIVMLSSNNMELLEVL